MAVAEEDAVAPEAVEDMPEPLRALGAGPSTLVSQGAEARLFGVQFLQRATVVKHRFRKRYRHPALDAKLTRQRVLSEARGLLKARKFGLLVPAVYHVDVGDACLYLERVRGRTLKSLIDGMGSAELEEVAKAVGAAVAAMHDADLVHGDLTTSNILRRDADGALVLIDFGLSTTSNMAEDKAVDLYVLMRAVGSAHAAVADAMFSAVLAEYKRRSRGWCATCNKLADVKMRGRKRTMVG